MTEWIKRKTTNKKFYGYTGPVKPDQSWMAKKSNKSYAKTEIVRQKDFTNPYIKRKVKKEPTSWLKKKAKEEKK